MFLLQKYLLISSLISFAILAEDSMKGKKCKYACGNYVELASENITLYTVERNTVKAVFSFISDSIPIYVLSREKYWNLIGKNFGPKTKTMGRKFMHPDKDEAEQWISNNKCKIGRICGPNSDCWGSGADYCYSDETSDWVSEKSFEYLNIWWETAFRETCTMDWECKLIPKKSPMHFNSEGESFIVVDDDKVQVYPGSERTMIKRKNYNIYIPKIPKESDITIHLDCFKHLKSLLCEGANGEMIKFEEGTKCTIIGPTKYCLMEGEFNRIRDFGANKYASVSDLNQVRDAFVVNQERENYNNYVLSLKIKKLQQTLIDLVASLSENNPQILNSLLKGNFFIRHLTGWTFELCSCEKEMPCEKKEFHSKDTRFCGDKVSSEEIQLFNVNKTLDYVIDDIFKFQGKDAHIIDYIMEEEEKGSEFQEEHSNPSFFGGIMGSMSPFSILSSSVSYIALFISVLAFLRR